MKKILFSIALMGMMVTGAHAKTDKHRSQSHMSATHKNMADPKLGLAHSYGANNCGTMAATDVTGSSWTGGNTVRSFTGYRSNYLDQYGYNDDAVWGYYHESLTPHENQMHEQPTAPESPNSDTYRSIAPQSPNSDIR